MQIDRSVTTSLRGRHRALAAIAEGLLGDAPLSAPCLHALIADFDAHLTAAGPLVRVGLLGLLEVLRWLPLFVIGRAAFVESLSSADRARFLERVEQSTRLGIVLVPFKTLLTISFYEQPGELERIGYIPQRRRYLMRETR
jgi:hypothetical protein